MSFRYPSGIIKPGFDPSAEPEKINFVYDRLYSWGYNVSGQLGLGDNVGRSSPVQVGGLTVWLESTSGYGHTLAIKSDGSLWAWGKNYNGQLGLGNVTYYSSPVQVGALTTWSKIGSGPGGGSDFSLAIKSNGTLWSWGANDSGQLGLGDSGSYYGRSSPVQVGALTTWANIFCGSNFSLAIKSNGSLWAWGNNYHGQLGLGDYAGRSSPVQVGALTTWANISCGSNFSLAIKSNGSLWAWGNNGYGQLGLGNVTYYSSPVQVGALTTWLKVVGGGYYTLAIKTDGTLWTWGRNDNGQLGLGNVTYRSSPVQVGALTTWSKIGNGKAHSLAIKTNGTLWSWGKNEYGQLGLGDYGSYYGRSSPVQVGALTSWFIIAPGYNHSIVISY